MILCGIDYSYTSPAICVYDTEDELKFDNLKFYNFFADSRKKKLNGTFGSGNIQINNHPEYSTQEERFRNICNWSVGVLKTHGVQEACIEGYSLGASSGLVFNIAENTGLIKQYMDINGIVFHTIPPTMVKKVFTGKGNAKKEAMVAEFYRRFPEGQIHSLLGIKEMSKPIDDICDSAAILFCHPHFKMIG